VSVPTLYSWRRQYGGMDTDSAKELKDLTAAAVSTTGVDWASDQRGSPSGARTRCLAACSRGPPYSPNCILCHYTRRSVHSNVAARCIGSDPKRSLGRTATTLSCRRRMAPCSVS
jgi:hypothetical protein